MGEGGGIGGIYFCSWCLSLRTILGELMEVSQADSEGTLLWAETL